MVHSRTLCERRRRLTKSASRQVASRQLSRRRRGLVRNGGTSLFSGQVFSEFSKQTQIVLNYLALKFDSVDPQRIRNNLQYAVQSCITHPHYIHLNQSNENELGDKLEKYKVKFAFKCPSTLSITAYYVPNQQSTQSAIQKTNSEYNAWLSKCSWGGSLFSLTGTAVSAATSIVDTVLSTTTRLGSDAVSSAATLYNSKDPSKISSKIVVQKDDKPHIKRLAKQILPSFQDANIQNMHIASSRFSRELTNAVLKYIPSDHRLYIEIPIRTNETSDILRLPSTAACQTFWKVDSHTGKVNWNHHTYTFAVSSEGPLGITVTQPKNTTQMVYPYRVLFREFAENIQGQTAKHTAQGKLVRNMWLIQVNDTDVRNQPYNDLKHYLQNTRPIRLTFSTFYDPNEHTILSSNVTVTVTSKLDKQKLSTQVFGGKRLRTRSRHKPHCTRRRHTKLLSTHTNRAPGKYRRAGGMRPASLVQKKVTDLAGSLQNFARESFTDNKYQTFLLNSATEPKIDATFDTAFQHVRDRHKLVYKDLLTVYQQYYAVREGELFFEQDEDEKSFLTFCAHRLQYVSQDNLVGTELIKYAMKQDHVFRDFILNGTNQCTTSVTDIWKNMGEKAGTMFKEPFPFTLNDSSGIQAQLPVKGTVVQSPAYGFGDSMQMHSDRRTEV